MNGKADAAQIKLNLRFGETRRTVTLEAPIAPLTTTGLLPILQEFDNEVVALAEEETARQGKRISCCAGCGACCRQLVPIAEAEAVHLAEVVAAMPAERRAEIERRFDAALAEYQKAGILEQLDVADQIPDEDGRGAFAIAYFRVGVPCPFLENESCGIYADRPLACREFLVTSPAENCRNPGPDNIERVPLPAQLSETFYRFSAAGDRQAARWFPLVLALHYAEQQTAAQPKTTGADLLQRFLGQLSKPRK